MLNQSEVMLTDSGGVQRGTYLFRKLVVVLRRSTERVGLVKTGMAELCDIVR